MATFSGTDNYGVIRQSRQLCYVAEGIDGVFLSRRACTDLGLISQEFPKIGCFTKTDLCVMSSNKDENKVIESYELSTHETDSLADRNKCTELTCQCPTKELPLKYQVNCHTHPCLRIEKSSKTGYWSNMRPVHLTNARVNRSP